MKRTIRLTESELIKIISEKINSVNNNISPDDLYDDILMMGYDKEILNVITNFLENKEGKMTSKEEYYRVMVNTISNITKKLLAKYDTSTKNKEKFYQYMDEFVRHAFIEAGKNMKVKPKN